MASESTAETPDPSEVARIVAADLRRLRLTEESPLFLAAKGAVERVPAPDYSSVPFEFLMNSDAAFTNYHYRKWNLLLNEARACDEELTQLRTRLGVAGSEEREALKVLRIETAARALERLAEMRERIERNEVDV